MENLKSHMRNRVLFFLNLYETISEADAKKYLTIPANVDTANKNITDQIIELAKANDPYAVFYMLICGWLKLHGIPHSASLEKIFKNKLDEIAGNGNVDGQFIKSQLLHNPLSGYTFPYGMFDNYKKAVAANHNRHIHVHEATKLIIASACEEDLKRGNPHAKWRKSQMYTNGYEYLDIVKNPERAKRLIISASCEDDLKNGSPEAQWARSQMHKYGDPIVNIKIDMKLTCHYAIAAAREHDLQNGYPEAQWIASQIFLKGNIPAGIKPNMSRSRRFLYAAYMRGHEKAEGVYYASRSIIGTPAIVYKKQPFRQ